MLTRRDLLVALFTAGLTLGVMAWAQPDEPVMSSSVFAWDDIAVRPTDVGAVRQFFRAPTATLDELELHVTTLNPGASPHPPHQHPEEEVIIIREGTVEALVNGLQKRVGPGSVIFQASNQLHTLRNVGDVPATYHVISWQSPGMKKKAEK